MRWIVRTLALLAAAVLASSCTTSWTTFHGTMDRAGVAVSLPLVPPSSAWTSPALDGAIYGEPLVFANQVIVATENDSLYALDISDGHVVWARHMSGRRFHSRGCNAVTSSRSVSRVPRSSTRRPTRCTPSPNKRPP